MSNVFLELSFILILILLNGVLAMAEIAVVSARKARLQQNLEEGNAKAETALALANEPADFLSTVQVGITLVGVLAGAFGGATIAEHISEWLSRLPGLAPYGDALGVVIVVVTITYLTLILGELVPKRLGLNEPEKISMRIATPMTTLSKLALPIVRFLSISSDLVLRAIGVKPSSEPPVTEEEIKVLIDQGTQAGVFEESEQDMLEAIFRLADRRVGSLMTPRTDVIWLDMEDPWEENLEKIGSRTHSRFPVAYGTLDHVVGVVQAKDILAGALNIEPQHLKAAMRQPLYMPESMLALKALELFKESRVHSALVIDEFGGLQGLVTVFDILEAIVGDIPEFGETLEPGILQREDGTWLIDGMLPIDEFKDLFRLHDLPEEDRGYYQTLGGFVMTRLGRIPKTGDRFDWEEFCFEVIDMDGFRVDKVLVIPGDVQPCEDETDDHENIGGESG